jgi:hypothetical protein
MSVVEKIIRIEVTHMPNDGCYPAHIRVTGFTESGPFTIRKIEGLQTNKIPQKIELIEKIFSRLVGLEVKIKEQQFYRGEYLPRSIHRLVVPASLPDWSRGEWKDIIYKTK